MSKKNQIYIKPVGGLCNRMRAVDSCLSLAKALNKQVTVVWGRDHFLNCKFSDLFQPSENYRVIEENQFFGKKSVFPYLPGSKPTSILKRGLYHMSRSALKIRKEIWFEDLDNALIPLRESIGSGQIKDMQSYEQSALSYLSAFIPAIQEPDNVFVCSAWRLWPEQNYKKHFVPVKHLRERISEVTGTFNETTGIHIRRSDHSLSIQHSGLDKFKEMIDVTLFRNDRSTFFLATDCAKTELELKETYPGKIITFPKRSYNRNSTEGIQDALIDLLCLSETNKVLGSYFSSFSQIAAEISGIEKQTIS